MAQRGRCKYHLLNRTTNMCKRINTITSLKIEDNTLSELIEIQDHAYLHFKRLFGHPEDERLSLQCDKWGEDVDLISLKVEFSKDEIKKTV